MTQLIFTLALVVITAFALVAITNSAVPKAETKKDEPTAPISGKIFRRIYYVVREIDENGKTIFSYFPTHDLADAFRAYDWAKDVHHNEAKNIVIDQIFNSGSLYEAVMKKYEGMEYYKHLAPIQIVNYTL